MPDARFLNPITVLSTIGGISIDITQRVNENYEHIITENPIEDGSPSTDHIVNRTPKISIQGGFSDLKISNLVGPALTNQALKGSAKQDFDKLLELFVSRELFLVMDGFHLVKDMQFKNLQLLKEKEGFSVFFQAELWQVRKITLDAVTAGGRSITSIADASNRAKTAPQLLLAVGAVSIKSSLESIGVLA